MCLATCWISSSRRATFEHVQNNRCHSRRILSPCAMLTPTAMNVPTILFVLCAELLAQRRLLLKEHEEMHGGGAAIANGLAGPNTTHSPTHPAGKPPVHGVADVSVETHHHQFLRLSERGRCAAPRSPEIQTHSKVIFGALFIVGELAVLGYWLRERSAASSRPPNTASRAGGSGLMETKHQDNSTTTATSNFE